VLSNHQRLVLQSRSEGKMVAQTFLVTSRDSDARSLAIQGQSIIQAYLRIHAYISEKMGESHAALFAEPNADRSRGTIDWYAEPIGDVIRFVDAGEVEKQSAATQIDTTVNGITQLAQELVSQSDPEDQLLGQLLQLALEVPSKECIYLVGNEPVLACWGSLVEGPEAHEHVLSKLTTTLVLPNITDLERAVPIELQQNSAHETDDLELEPKAVHEKEQSKKVFWRWGWDWLRWLIIIVAMIVLGILLSYLLRSCDPNVNVNPSLKEENTQQTQVPLPKEDENIEDDNVKAPETVLKRPGGPYVKLPSSLLPLLERERELRRIISDIRKKIIMERQKCQVTQLSCPSISVDSATQNSKANVQVLGLAFDTSLSMLYPETLSLEDERKLSEIDSIQLMISTREKGETTRADVALQALENFIHGINTKTQIGLILSEKTIANQCVAKDIKFFNASQDSGIKDAIQQSQGAVMAIADSIRVGAHALAKKTAGATEGAPMLLVLVTDASSTCGNPSEIAIEMKSKYPGLIINIVSLTESDVAKSVAATTGGQIYKFDESIDVSTALRFAAGQKVPPQCVPQ
jgi:hypothetical protein